MAHCPARVAIPPTPHAFRRARSRPAETHGRQTSRASHRPTQDLISALPRSAPERPRTATSSSLRATRTSCISLSFFLLGNILVAARRPILRAFVSREALGLRPRCDNRYVELVYRIAFQCCTGFALARPFAPTRCQRTGTKLSRVTVNMECGGL